MRLIYVGDPLCSWCYGFGAELAELADRSQAFVEVIVGGLRAFGTETIDGQFADFLQQHWQQVAQRAGVPFAKDGLEKLKGLTYDTEPACRAVVTARLLTPQLSPLPVFRAIQQAFYAEARDVTHPDVLTAIVTEALTRQGIAITTADVGAALVSDQARAATRADFALCHRLGVRGFPTLLQKSSDTFRLLANGYTSVEDMLAELEPPA